MLSGGLAAPMGFQPVEHRRHLSGAQRVDR